MSSGAALLSPLTGKRMGESLVPNEGLARLLLSVESGGACRAFRKTAASEEEEEEGEEDRGPETLTRTQTRTRSDGKVAFSLGLW